MWKKIAACLMAAIIILSLLNLGEFTVEDDFIFLDDEEIYQSTDQQKIYDELFDINSVIKINLNIDTVELANIQKDLEIERQKNSKSSTYRYANSLTVTINDKKYVINDVGVRLKGNSSRANFYNDLFGVYNLVNFKLSFNETFEGDKYKQLKKISGVETSSEEEEKRRQRTFATLEKLELKWNITRDNTYTRNIYAFEMFKDNDILAQKCRLAVFSINQSVMGVYRFFEPVDEKFLNRYLPEDQLGGDLYKCKWVNLTPVTYQLDNTYGVSHRDDGMFYNFELKTNQDSSDHHYLKRLLTVLNKKNLSREELESVVDMDNFLRFSAINYLIGNQDDMRNNYNNHYIYFRPSDGKAIFIPYDCECCLGSILSWNSLEDGMVKESPYSDVAASVGKMQLNPLINLTITNQGMYKDEFNQHLREVASSEWMLSMTFDKYYNILEQNYSQYVISSWMYCSTWHQNVEFSKEGGAKANGNMAVDDFLNQIRRTLYMYIE